MRWAGSAETAESALMATQSMVMVMVIVVMIGTLCACIFALSTTEDQYKNWAGK
jgi:sensor histidine kinase regulating citrate/malate metabolism